MKLNNNLDNVDLSPYAQVVKYKQIIARFKEYDAERKEYIKSLLNELEETKDKLQETQDYLDDANAQLTDLSMNDASYLDINAITAKYQTKIRNQRAEIKRLSQSSKIVPKEVSLDEHVFTLNQAIQRITKQRNTFQKLYTETLHHLSDLMCKQMHGHDGDIIDIITKLIENSKNYLSE